jgi:gp16 family phage-associated protein
MSRQVSPARMESGGAKTIADVRREFAEAGVSISAWARANGFTRSLVSALLRPHSRLRGHLGEAHRCAVALGLKAGHVADVERFKAASDHGPRTETCCDSSGPEERLVVSVLDDGVICEILGPKSCRPTTTGDLRALAAALVDIADTPANFDGPNAGERKPYYVFGNLTRSPVL